MLVQDLNGKNIIVTDLKKAISQAKSFSNYSHEDKSFAKADAERKAYWSDLHEKLKTLITTTD